MAGAVVQGLEIRPANFFVYFKTLVGIAGRREGDALYPVCEVALVPAGLPRALCAYTERRAALNPPRAGVGSGSTTGPVAAVQLTPSEEACRMGELRGCPPLEGVAEDAAGGWSEGKAFPLEEKGADFRFWL